MALGLAKLEDAPHATRIRRLANAKLPVHEWPLAKGFLSMSHALADVSPIAMRGETASRAAETERDKELESIRDALLGLRFGSLLIHVQDGVIVQIDRTEKRRLRRPRD
jgi:hypothetical protein